MVLAICAGGTIIMENPQNSLVAMQGRFAWLVELLSGQNISAPWFHELSASCKTNSLHVY